MPYFYFDQGGIVGKPVHYISDIALILDESTMDNISNYYVGFMSLWAIDDYLSLFEFKHKIKSKLINYVTTL